MACAPGVMKELRQRAARSPKRIVFTQPDRDPVLSAAVRLAREGLAHPILLGDADQIRVRAERIGLSAAGVAIVCPEPGPAYRSLWAALWASRGVRAVEAEESLRAPLAYARVMVAAGDAASLVRGPGPERGPSAGPLGRNPGRVRYFILGGADAGGSRTRLVAEPLEAVPPASLLADLALAAAIEGERLTGSRPRIAFVAPGVPASLERRIRFRSARDELEARVRQAIETLRARDGDLAVEDRLHFDVSGLDDAVGNGLLTLVLTHPAGGESGDRVAGLTGASSVVGPVCQGSGEIWGESSEGSDDLAIADLAVLTALSGDSSAHTKYRREKARRSL